MDIINSSPIKVSTFDKMWITNINIAIPHGTQKGAMVVQLSPTDGTNLLVSNKIINICNLVEEMDNNLIVRNLIKVLITEIKRISKIITTIEYITIASPTPQSPVRVNILFTDADPFRIKDLSVLIKTDPILGENFQSILGGIAALADLSVA